MSKTLIVAGSAPCLFEDLAAARTLYEDADVMTINESCGGIENIQHMLAGHTVKAEAFWKYRQDKFPFWHEPVRVHASWHRVYEAPKDEYPSVTDWWGGEVSTGATSAGKAIRIGFKLEYDPIILVGFPMNGSGYFNPNETDYFQKKFTRFGKCLRIGDPNMQHHHRIEKYRIKFAELAKTEWKGRVFSMSGFTRDCLGAPDGL
jgi:hypothetical protein